MRSVPTTLNNELLKDANFFANLVELYLSSTVYFTNLDVDIVYGGNRYLSRGLTFSGAEYSLSPQIDKISFEIDNVGLEFSSFVLNQETRGKRCNIRLAALGNTTNEMLSNGGFEDIGTVSNEDYLGWISNKVGSSSIGNFARILSEDGEPILSEDGIPVLSESDEVDVSYRGNRCCVLVIDGSDSHAAIYQAFSLVPGVKYRLQVTYKNSEAGKTAALYLYTAFTSYPPAYHLHGDGTWAADGGIITLANSTEWKNFALDFYPHPDHTNYVLYLSRDSAASSTIYFDEVSLKSLTGGPASVIAADMLFRGILDGAKLNHQRATFDVYSPLIFWRRQIPRRIHQPSCAVPFKGSLCAYAGAEVWCDQSYERCLSLGNEANFRGFRFLPDIQNKQIWWGRSPAR